MTFQEVMTEIKEFLAKPLYTMGETEGTVGTALVVALMIVATIWVASLVGKAVQSAFKRAGTQDLDSVLPYIRAVKIFVLFIGFGVAFNTLGFELTAVFAAGGLFAVAIGFAMKNIAENFVSGLIMRMEKSIKRGDILEVEQQVVTIKDVGVRYTLARNRDDEDLMIPNSILVQSMVTNRTLRDHLYRLRAPVGVVYSSDMKQVRDVLESVADAIPWRSRRKEPIVVMRTFGSSSVDFEVSVWIEDAFNIGLYISDLNEAIWWSLKDAGIVIAFPQLDVHFDPEVEDSLRGLRRAG